MCGKLGKVLTLFVILFFFGNILVPQVFAQGKELPGVLSSAKGGAVPSMPPAISGVIKSDQEKQHEISVDPCQKVTFALALYTPGELEFVLTTPGGKVLAPSVSDAGSGITYVSEERMQRYEIRNPESGMWKIKTRGVKVPPDGVTYTILTFIEQSAEQAVIVYPKMTEFNFKPNDSIPIKAVLECGKDLAAVDDIVIGARVVKPDGSADDLQLFDDGLHGDSGPQDRSYGNVYKTTSQEGAYAIIISAQGKANGKQFFRSVPTTVWVVLYPELTLDNSSISFSDPPNYAGDTLKITARIRNVGNGEAKNAEIFFYQDSPDGIKIGTDKITIRQGQTKEASVQWIPPKAGSYEIYVVISPYNEFLESNYDNNKANRKIDVLQK